MVELGVDVFLGHRALYGFRKRSLGLVTNYANTDAQLNPVIDRFLNADVKLKKLFGPEHGVKNAAKEGESVDFEEDGHSQVPAYSLYGAAKKPTRRMLEGVDAVVIDLQDVGSRYYTNVSTMFLCMEACSEQNIPCIVLDRPNPIGAQREGYPLDLAYQSFVGMLPIPNRHGCTMGELARFIERTFLPEVNLTVIPVKRWTRNQLFSETGLQFTPPSPNTTCFYMMLLYPGTCLFEGTNVSVGRGTTHPFETIGAPWMDGHRLADHLNQSAPNGVKARPVYFSPFYSQYKGELCSGVQFHVTDPHRFHALAFGIQVLDAIQTLHPESFTFTYPREGTGVKPFFDLLAGGPTLRETIERGDAKTYLAEESDALAEFAKRMEPFLMYE